MIELFTLMLGTGLGSTIVNSHVPAAGAYNIAEDGILYLAPCKEAITEAYFSARWIVKEYQELSGKQISGIKEVAESTWNGSATLEVFHRFEAHLSEFFCHGHTI